MKTIRQIKDGWRFTALDGRDLMRFAQFIPEERLSEFGLSIKEEFKGKHKSIEMTRENIIKQLKEDVEFGFEKALDKRGISSSLMAEVVRMWNWILEEGLEHFNEYAQYGLPIFKATAVKYGFDNPIGDDCGNEAKYSCDA